MAIAGSENAINGLPTELLCRVLWLAIDPQNSQEGRCRLCLVCRQWMECIEGSAFLWTDISTGSGGITRTYMRQALEKSKEAMINLDYSAFSIYTMTPETFLVEAAPHTARWRSLRVLLWRSSTVSPLATLQAPRLENLELVMRTVRGPEPGDTITLFSGAPAPPTLRHLTLGGVQVALKPLSLSGLVSLNLCFVITLSTPQLLEILRNSPNLETLRLEANPGLGDIGAQPSVTQPIVLQKLVSLSLRALDRGGTTFILSTIRIPNHRSIFISDEIRDHSVRTLFTPAISHILHTTIPSSNSRFSNIEVKVIDGGLFSIRFRGIEFETWVGELEQIPEILTWMVEGLGSEVPECPVRLKVDSSAVDIVRLVSLPPPLVVRHVSIPVALFEDIALSRPLESTSSQWPFAHMDTLSVKLGGIEWQKHFISLLRSLYGKASSHGEAELRRPASLWSVELRGVTRAEGLVEEIMEILGEANVFWADE